MVTMSIVSIMYFLLFVLLRAYITKYVLLRLSIQTTSIFSLFKKYFLIAIIINIPFILVGILLYNDLNDTDEKLDLFFETVIIPMFYLFEAFLITKIIKDKEGKAIKFKIAFVLVLIFFITDTILDLFYPMIEETFVSQVDTYYENEVSSLLEGEQ